MDKYHWDVVGSFIWGLFQTSRRRTDGTTSLHPLETSSRHTNKTSWRRTTETSWRRSTETSLGVSFETYLRRRWDVQRDIVTTSPRRLFAGWVPFLSFKETAHSYLLKISITHKKVNSFINLLISCISARSASQILSMKGYYTFFEFCKN